MSFKSLKCSCCKTKKRTISFKTMGELVETFYATTGKSILNQKGVKDSHGKNDFVCSRVWKNYNNLSVFLFYLAIKKDLNHYY